MHFKYVWEFHEKYDFSYVIVYAILIRESYAIRYAGYPKTTQPSNILTDSLDNFEAIFS